MDEFLFSDFSAQELETMSDSRKVHSITTTATTANITAFPAITTTTLTTAATANITTFPAITTTTLVPPLPSPEARSPHPRYIPLSLASISPTVPSGGELRAAVTGQLFSVAK